MATIRITSTRNIKAAISYAGSGKMHTEHDGIPERVLSKSGHLVNVNDATYQMKKLQDMYGKGDGTNYVQGYRLTQSFSKDELNPQDKDNWEQANELGYKFAEKLYDNHQYVVYTHADGETGCLHNHIIVNAVNMEGKSLRGIKTRSFKPLAKQHDEFLKAEGFNQTLDKYNYEKVHKTHDEYAEYVESENIKDMLDENAILKDVDTKRKDFDDHITNGEYYGRKSGKYLWKDDLRERLVQSLVDPNVTDMNTYKDKLEKDHNIQLEYATRRKQKVLRYRFTDMNGKNHKIQANSLGQDYTESDLDEHFRQIQEENTRNIEQQQLQQQQQQQQAIDELNKKSEQRAINELAEKYRDEPIITNYAKNGQKSRQNERHHARSNKTNGKTKQKTGWEKI